MRACITPLCIYTAHAHSRCPCVHTLGPVHPYRHTRHMPHHTLHARQARASIQSHTHLSPSQHPTLYIRNAHSPLRNTTPHSTAHATLSHTLLPMPHSLTLYCPYHTLSPLRNTTAHATLSPSHITPHTRRTCEALAKMAKLRASVAISLELVQSIERACA